jgi:ribosomal protein S18 acetylase RimI-like enzyme
MSNTTVRKARLSDAPAIVDVYSTAFLATYPNEEAGFTRQALAKRHALFSTTEQRIATYKNLISRSSKLLQVYVATNGGEVVGYTAPMIHGPANRRRLGAMHVRPELHRQGIGSMLMEQALAWHGPNSDVYLQVGRHLTGIQNFYRQFGFEETGAAVVDEYAKVLGCVALDDIEMVRHARPIPSQYIREEF